MFPEIVCLCGSTRFKEQFFEWNKRFTQRGFIVLMPGVFGHSGDNITDEQKIQLDSLHKQKIRLSDFIFIIDQDEYIGESTRSEIEFAKRLGKEIYYLSHEKNYYKSTEKKEND